MVNKTASVQFTHGIVAFVNSETIFSALTRSQSFVMKAIRVVCSLALVSSVGHVGCKQDVPAGSPAVTPATGTPLPDVKFVVADVAPALPTLPVATVDAATAITDAGVAALDGSSASGVTAVQTAVACPTRIPANGEPCALPSKVCIYHATNGPRHCTCHAGEPNNAAIWFCLAPRSSTTIGSHGIRGPLPPPELRV